MPIAETRSIMLKHTKTDLNMLTYINNGFTLLIVINPLELFIKLFKCVYATYELLWKHIYLSYDRI